MFKKLHEISCIFGTNAFSTPPPLAQTVKNFFSGFIHFMKFPPYDNYCMPICWDLGSTRLCIYLNISLKQETVMNVQMLIMEFTVLLSYRLEKPGKMGVHFTVRKF